MSASQDDLQVYYHEVKEIESIECSTSLALTRVSNLDSQLAKLERDASAAALNSDVGAIRKDLHGIAADLAGDPREPNHLNLRGKINWLRIQVGGFTGRPTPAQIEWIGRFVADRDRLVKELDAVMQGSVARLNARLKAAGLAEIR